MLEWTVETHSLFCPVPATPCNLALFFPRPVQQRRNELSRGCPRRLAQIRKIRYVENHIAFVIYKQNQGSGKRGLLCFPLLCVVDAQPHLSRTVTLSCPQSTVITLLGFC